MIVNQIYFLIIKMCIRDSTVALYHDIGKMENPAFFTGEILTMYAILGIILPIPRFLQKPLYLFEQKARQHLLPTLRLEY